MKDGLDVQTMLTMEIRREAALASLHAPQGLRLVETASLLIVNSPLGTKSLLSSLLVSEGSARNECNQSGRTW